MKYLLILLFLINIPAPSSTNLVSDGYVWICTGKAAYSYHNNRNCSGLNRCKASIKKVTLEKALSMKRTACDICYKN